jgi:hypothetical protein
MYIGIGCLLLAGMTAAIIGLFETQNELFLQALEGFIPTIKVYFACYFNGWIREIVISLMDKRFPLMSYYPEETRVSLFLMSGISPGPMFRKIPQAEPKNP